MSKINLDGRSMRPVSAAPEGVVSADTLMTFSQNGEVVSAHYRGGSIVEGYLVGRLEPGMASLRFCYAQTDTTGRIDSGQSSGVIERLADGRLRLTEAFRWFTRESCGTNIFEEPVASTGARAEGSGVA